MIKRFIIFCFLSSTFFTSAQDACEVVGGPVAFENSTFNGAVITSPKGTVNITNNYNTPSENLAYTNELLALMQRLYADASFRNLSPKAQADYLLNEESKIKNARVALEKERMGIAIQEKNLNQVKKDFQNEITKQKRAFEKLLASIPKGRSSKLINDRIEELKTKGENIIQSANSCLVNDFELVPIEEVNTGKIIYGFSLEEIRNDPSYVMIDDYADGMARVKRANKFGFYNSKGELVIDFKYDYAERFVDGEALIENLGRWFLIDKKGKETFRFSSDTKEMSYAADGVYIWGSKKGVFRLTNRKGEFISSKVYDGLEVYPLDSKKIITRKKDAKGKVRFSITNLKGKELITGFGQIVINEIIPFTSEAIFIRIGELYYYLNLEKFNFILGDYYKELEIIPQFNLAIVSKYGKKGICNQEGEEVLEIDYLSISKFDNQGFAIVNSNLDKSGLVNAQGRLIVDCKYTKILPFDLNGLAITANFNDLNRFEYGLINKNGLEIIPLIFDHLSFVNNDKNEYTYSKIGTEDYMFKQHTYILRKDDKNFNVNSRGKCISPNANEYKQIIREHYRNKKSK